MQLWLSPTPSGPGLVLLEKLEGEESIAWPSARACQQQKGSGKGDSPFLFPGLSAPLRSTGVWGLWNLWQGVVCAEENATSKTFSISGSYSLQLFLGLHWNVSSANWFRTTNSAFHSTSLPGASGWEESAGIMAMWIQFQSTQKKRRVCKSQAVHVGLKMKIWAPGRPKPGTWKSTQLAVHCVSEHSSLTLFQGCWRIGLLSREIGKTESHENHSVLLCVLVSLPSLSCDSIVLLYGGGYESSSTLRIWVRFILEDSLFLVAFQ